MDNRLPGIVVSGASGFIGRHFVTAAQEEFRLFCIARRNQKEVGIPQHKNIHWLQADITNWKKLLKVIEYIKARGGADYTLHLAGYYDFTLNENPAYEKNNVTGTRHLLEMSQMLGIRRFIFSSSLAACKIPPPGRALTEESPADAEFPYARSKAKEERIITQYSTTLPASIVRLAAVYSDWCEYPLLYMLLNSWLSKNILISKILAGKGESAIPYIHINDLVKLFLRIIEISESLPRLAIYNASPQGSVSHFELFKTATRYYYGRYIKPFHMPTFLSALGLIVLSLLNRITGKEPLEQPWMWKYIDTKLHVDASATYHALNWKPASRYNILRRLLFLTENMINYPNNWTFKNEAILKRVAYRKSTTIYDILTEQCDALVEKIIKEVMKPENDQRFPNYQKMDRELLKWYITLNYQLVAAATRKRDRSMLPHYAQTIAYRRFAEGFKVREVKDLMLLTGKTMKKSLYTRPELKGAKHRIDDYIILTSQFVADEFEDVYEMIEAQLPEQVSALEPVEPPTSIKNLHQIVRQLEDIFHDPSSSRPTGVLTYKNYGFLIKLTIPDE